jgi:hypothetical protein
MLVKVSDLNDIALDWAVSVCLTLQAGGGPELVARIDPRQIEKHSTDWSQGGPIIEREAITLRCNTITKGPWIAFLDTGGSHNAVSCRQTGPTPLVAAMRCFVALKLGSVVDIPDELM